MKLKKLATGFVLGSILVLGACGNTKEDKGTKTTSKSEVSASKSTKKEISKEAKENSGLGNYIGLKIGDTVAVKYAKVVEGKIAFDFTLNSLKFTDQALGGEEPRYESGFVIADITLKNTGKEALEVGMLDGLSISSGQFGYGKDYIFEGFDDASEIPVGESQTGKMVTGYKNLEAELIWGIEGFTTLFSYDIKPEDYGEYVAE